MPCLVHAVLRPEVDDRSPAKGSKHRLEVVESPHGPDEPIRLQVGGLQQLVRLRRRRDFRPTERERERTGENTQKR